MRLVALAVVAACTSSARPAVVDASVVFSPRSGDPVDGHVRCAMARAFEIACALSHEGSATLEVCFHADIKCRNGNTVTAEACRSTPPGTEMRSEHQAEGCDAIGEGVVTNAWIIEK